MKKLLLIVAIIFTFNIVSPSQTFDFCTSVRNGIAQDAGNKWTCSDASCFILGLLKLPYISNDDYVIYDVYKISSDGTEYYYDSYNYYTSGVNWSWIYQKMYFANAGTYNVYIYSKSTYNSSKKYIGFSTIHWTFY